MGQNIINLPAHILWVLKRLPLGCQISQDTISSFYENVHSHTQANKHTTLRSSPSVGTFFSISECSCFVIRFLCHIFFVMNFSYFVIRFYY